MGCTTERRRALDRKRQKQICEWPFRGQVIKFDVRHDRIDKEKAKMTLFEKFVMEGHEDADRLAKEGPDLDGGAMATIKAATVMQERMGVHAALQHAATFHCQMRKWQNEGK